MSIDEARHGLKARITDYGADCAGHKAAGKGSLADALDAGQAYALAVLEALKREAFMCHALQRMPAPEEREPPHTWKCPGCAVEKVRALLGEP